MAPTFVFTGTEAEKQWLQTAWLRIKFPWEKITRFTTLTLGVKDLDQGLGKQIAAVQKKGKQNVHHDAEEAHHPDPSDILKDRPGMPAHVHIHDPKTGQVGHAFSALVPGTARRKVAGVFWTDGRIYIDNEFQNEIGYNVMASEAGHFVDYGLPLTDAEKVTIMAWWHPHGADQHTWWEINSYSAEYFTLGGEAFMDLFDAAYTDNAIGTWPNHSSSKALGDQLRVLLNIPRTDAKVPDPVDPPPVIHDFASLKIERAWITIFGNAKVKLVWTPFEAGTSKNVGVWRQDDGVWHRVYTTPNDGSFTQNLKKRRGTFSYQLRTAGTGITRTSNTVTTTLQ